MVVHAPLNQSNRDVPTTTLTTFSLQRRLNKKKTRLERNRLTFKINNLF